MTRFPRSEFPVSDGDMKCVETFEYFHNHELLFGMLVFHEFGCFEDNKSTYFLKYRFYDAKGHEINLKEDSE